jgi:arsenate reductase-like glutaredoxin family protein
VDARKAPLEEREALKLLEDVEELYTSKGKRVVHVDLKREKPDKAILLGLLLGPTGKLRAPTLRKGRSLLVGFDEQTYRQVLS